MLKRWEKLARFLHMPVPPLTTITSAKGRSNMPSCIGKTPCSMKPDALPMTGIYS